MSNKVDNIFKTKLEEHSLPPSGKAWEKLEANLSKKNKAVVWFRLVAAVALIGIFTFVILQWMDKGDTQPVLVIENNKTKTPEIAQPEIVKPNEAPLNQAQTTKSVASRTQSKKKKKQKEEETLSAKRNEPVLISEKKEEIITDNETFEKAEKVVSEKPITLVFTLPTIKSKTNNEEQVAASEEKKTALQKVVETANDIRSGDVLGDLREVKNELFALEFRKDKSKKQE
jgi:hypothetical protein